MSGKHQKRTGREKGGLLFCSVFFLLGLGITFFGSLLLANWETGIVRLPLWTSLLTLAVCSWYVLSVSFVFYEKWTSLKTSLSVAVFLLFALIVAFILQETGFFLVLRDEKLLREYLQRAGLWMPLLYVVLQFLQVVVLPIPSIVSTVAGVALFGAFQALVYSFIGIVLGSFVAFWIGRKLGIRAVSWIVGEDALKRWRKKLKGKDNLFLTAMFLLPLFPDDILCFLAGISTMRWGYFVGITLLSRLLALSATCYSVDFIPFTTWWGIMIWGIFLISFVLLFVFLYKNMDRIQQKIDNIKGKIRKRK